MDSDELTGMKWWEWILFAIGFAAVILAMGDLPV